MIGVVKELQYIFSCCSKNSYFKIFFYPSIFLLLVCLISYCFPQKHPDNRQCPQLFHLSLQLPKALPGREYIIQQDNILSSDIPPCELQVPQYVLILSLSFQLLAVFLYPDGLETVRNAQPFRQVVAYHRKAFPLSFPC